jgi:hypothetical protein
MPCKDFQRVCAEPGAKGEYVRLTFRPAGACRNRVVWAIRIGEGRYYRAAEDGGRWEDPSTPENVSRNELILGQGTEQPAGVCLLHGVLELI